MLVSVITPSFNRANLLENAYESLKNQTNLSFEWIIVDDGSSDNTEEVVLEIVAEKKLNIQYFKKENGGKHTAVNLGIQKAKRRTSVNFRQ